MKLYILTGLLIVFIARMAYAQEQDGDKIQADRLFERYEYFSSLNIYLKLAEKNDRRVSITERIADCYRLLNRYAEAGQWYARALKQPGAKPADTFYYAEVLLRNHQYDDARTYYKKYFDKQANNSLLAFKLALCDSAAAWSKKEVNYRITSNDAVNSRYDDWGMAYGGKNELVFVSDRPTGNNPGTKKTDQRTGNEWLKLFSYDQTTGKISELLFDNSGDIKLDKYYHIGPVAFNPRADTAYITVTTRVKGRKIKTDKTGPETDQRLYTRRLELLIATKKGDKWGNFKPFPYNNVNMFSVGYAALSPDGQIIYFVSDRPGGYGKSDIWYSIKGGDYWNIPYNCGPVINTAEEESFPFMGPDDRLYFSSRGLPGMGGYDVFSAVGYEKNWNKPINLKYPLNSTSDDFAYVTNNGNSGFFSSNREGGKGNDDIYSFTFNPDKDSVKNNALPQLPGVPIAAAPVVPPAAPQQQQAIQKKPDVAPSPLVTPPEVPAAALSLITLNGTVADAAGNPLDSVTVIVRNTRGITTAGGLITANKIFSFSVPARQDYIIEARKKGYYPATAKVPIALQTVNTSLQLSLKMEPLEVGKTFVIRNIYYDLNMARIRRDAMVELDKLVQLMQENPTLRIELSSHTDSRGSDYYNMLLSQARATSAVNYIKRRGIAASRMVARGYGETRLLNKCGNGIPCTEEEHQLNRRTEIKVIGLDKAGR